MRGQWLGAYTSAISGKIMVNIDQVDDHFEGVAYLTPATSDIPGTAAFFETPNTGDIQRVTAYLNPIDPRTGLQGGWEEMKSRFPEGVRYSSTAQVNLRLQGDKLHIDAVSDLGVNTTSVLTKSSANAVSKIQGQVKSWSQFKSHISEVSKFNFVFRGQQKPWSLCTSFHRRSRFRMSVFTNKDVRQLHQRLSAITSHFFDLAVPDQNGAFFNLLQHHGYPTPLLDWSHSPYVAAFFAFRDLPIDYKGEEVVRIYVFNNQEWQNRYKQIQNLDPAFQHLSIMEFIAIDNPRLVPQQSVTTVTNLHDIEAYILEKEVETGVRFLTAIDIPASEREVAMRDLRFMGITAGSMFPSIDGVCEELRERNFDQ